MPNTKQKPESFFDEEDSEMGKQREAGQQGGETQEEDDTKYFSEVSPLRDQETQNEPNAKEQTEEDEMDDI